MTVETETVASVPQSGLAERAASGRNDVSTLRLKPSSETIRPRKDRRKPGAKARSINQGTASTKADLFEARVASAVDEANTSDSDETFVYESNPEPRRSRHHSRTPSVASLHSIVDTQRAMLRTAGEMDTPRVTGKRSFKFSNPPFSDVDSADNGGGTVRAYQPRYIGGKYGRGVSHASTVEDSPFTQATKSRSTHTLRPSRPPSPRSPSGQQRVSLFSRKDNLFDFDPEACDDERTPLVGSIRSPRGLGRTHRTHYERHPRSRFRRFGGCLLGACVLMAVVLSTVAFLALSNRPLSDVRVQRIDNVLASEDELMLDLVVSAVNPNVLGIAVGSMDINVFAKSPHVAAMTGGVDDGTDPPGEDLGRDAHTMLLGRIFDFDQALSFGGSPLKHHAHSSRGELRLAHPGNVTKAGEQNRWERTIQHPFELIIRGVLQYQLPISNHMQRVSVGASVMVHPEDGIDETGRMRVKPLRPREREGMRLDWRR
ncbi:hypothetical protein K470DRAFT_213418 [Piedraia hortae CBS 480.64]|uniref:Uncharacterized protein n=1 Tax=Piedraia hortae CBS 480.64 TaxID=1314780 RepID=A0A6A7C4Q7_9PEZI|nr:hypothetical protein K470DRAFT_213418 [Piedraia hortae CBS 480.64]